VGHHRYHGISQATGTITLSTRGKTASPGQKSTRAGRAVYANGALELKVGKTFRAFTDEKYVADASLTGEIKLRVKDSDYVDNSGSYTVRLIVVRAPVPDATMPAGRVQVATKKTFDDTSLTPDAVLGRLQQTYFQGIKRCYKDHLAKHRHDKGRVELAFTVDKDGRVVSPTVKGFTGELDTCIKAQMDSWKFPPPKDEDGEATDASFSITLALLPD
jgi:hypothetical protein